MASDLRGPLRDLADAERRAPCPELPSTPPSPEPQCSWLCSNQGRDHCATGIHRGRPWCRIVVAAECIEETRVPTPESARAMLGRLTRG